MASILTAGEAVARVAYLSSDVIISVQPSLATDSEFSKFLTQYATNKANSIVCQTLPEILPVRKNADPLLSAFQPLRDGKLTSVTTTSDILVKSIPHLYKLAQYPLVIHVSLNPTGYPDYGDITSIRNTGFTFVQSNSLQEAQDLSLTAHSLAIQSGRGVIHFFDSANSKADRPIQHESRQLCSEVLNVDLARAYQGTKCQETTIYASEGRRAVKPSAVPSEERARTLASGTLSPPTASTRDPSTASSSTDNKAASSAASEAESATTVESIAKPVSSDDVEVICSSIWSQIKAATGRSYSPFHYSGPSDAKAAMFLFGSDPGLFSAEFDQATSDDFFAHVGLITPVLYRPWLSERLVEALPSSVKKIAVLEQIKRKTTKWGPILLDLLMSLRGSGNGQGPLIVGYQLGYVEYSTVTQALSGIFQNLRSENPIQNLEIGLHESPCLCLCAALATAKAR